MSVKNILVGCDPELFVSERGILTSGYGLIPGTKENPFVVDKGAVQVDGMALEFNIDPAKNVDEFCINIHTVMTHLASMVPNHELVITPVAHFSPEYMEKQPAEALLLGCDPDFNGWQLAENIKPDMARPMRTASGHVHVGWTEGQDIYSEDGFKGAARAARQMDFFLGLPSLFYDKDTERREMYGKAGCFRPKSYGVEYRTLSNAWLRNEALMKWVYNNTIKGMQRLFAGDDLSERYGNIEDVINNSDLKKAQQILEKEGIEVCYG